MKMRRLSSGLGESALFLRLFRLGPGVNYAGVVRYGSHREGQDDQGERFVTVLEIPPVESPVTAVRASILADKQKRERK